MNGPRRRDTPDTLGSTHRYFVTITPTRPVRSRTVTPTSCACRSKSKSRDVPGPTVRPCIVTLVEEFGQAGVGHVHLTFDGVDREPEAGLQDQEHRRRRPRPAARTPPDRASGPRRVGGGSRRSSSGMRCRSTCRLASNRPSAIAATRVRQAVPREAGRGQRVVVRPDATRCGTTSGCSAPRACRWSGCPIPENRSGRHQRVATRARAVRVRRSR